MFTTIINTLFSISLFVTGGNIVSTNLKLHHYSDDDYKDIFHLLIIFSAQGRFI